MGIKCLEFPMKNWWGTSLSDDEVVACHLKCPWNKNGCCVSEFFQYFVHVSCLNCKWMTKIWRWYLFLWEKNVQVQVFPLQFCQLFWILLRKYVKPLNRSCFKIKYPRMESKSSHSKLSESLLVSKRLRVQIPRPSENLNPQLYTCMGFISNEQMLLFFFFKVFLLKLKSVHLIQMQ